MSRIKFTTGNAYRIEYSLYDGWYQLFKLPEQVLLQKKIRFNVCYKKEIKAPYCFELPEKNLNGSLKIFSGLRESKYPNVYTGNKFEKIEEGKKILSTIIAIFTPDREYVTIYYFQRLILKGYLLDKCIKEVQHYHNTEIKKSPIKDFALFKHNGATHD